MLQSLSRFWNLIRERRNTLRQWRAEWCTVRFDEAAIEIEVQERPVWRNRVAWDQIAAVGVERKGILGPGLYLFLNQQPGPAWASLEGTGGPELHEELKRRGVAFRPLADLWRELDERLRDQARRLVREQFPQAEWRGAERALASYRGPNIGRTHLAIVRLANGHLTRLRELVVQARRHGSAPIISRDFNENMSVRLVSNGDAG